MAKEALETAHIFNRYGEAIARLLARRYPGAAARHERH
jgi:hypothetical protein